MANVTLTGAEYKALILAEHELEEIKEWILSRNRANFEVESRYSNVEWGEEEKMPNCIFKLLTDDMVERLENMNETALKNWATRKARYFNPAEKRFEESHWRDDGVVDLISRSDKLRRVWEEVKAAEEAETKEEEAGDE